MRTRRQDKLQRDDFAPVLTEQFLALARNREGKFRRLSRQAHIGSKQEAGPNSGHGGTKHEFLQRTVLQESSLTRGESNGLDVTATESFRPSTLVTVLPANFVTK